MANNGKHYGMVNTGALAALREKGRVMVGSDLGLTGCEISLNAMAAGQASPFEHSHKLNEEVYIVLDGSGTFTVDGETFPISQGSVVRVAPQGVRSMAAGDGGLAYICIQAQAGSLTQATQDDGVIHPA